MKIFKEWKSIPRENVIFYIKDVDLKVWPYDKDGMRIEYIIPEDTDHVTIIYSYEEREEN